MRRYFANLLHERLTRAINQVAVERMFDPQRFPPDVLFSQPRTQSFDGVGITGQRHHLRTVDCCQTHVWFETFE